MSNVSDPATYVAAVVTLYVELPDTPLRASVSDQWLARRFHDDGVPLHVVETALLHDMSVDELNDLDLSYTPPFGSPWDPAQVAAQAWMSAQQEEATRRSP